MRRIALITMLLCSVQAACADEIAKKQVALAVGDDAPNFELKDQNGKVHTLKTLIAQRPTAIVFHRSADW